MNSCLNKDEKMILFLFDNGADFHVKNNKGETAISILKRKRNLSPEIQALKEKIILEQQIENANGISLCI